MASETMYATIKVKAKLCFFIFYFCCHTFVLHTESAGFNDSDVAKYLIRRRAADNADFFGVLFKETCKQGCNPRDMVAFCNGFSADSTASLPNFPLSCVCKSDKRTFLPENGKCLTNEEVVKVFTGKQSPSAVGCSQYQLPWQQFFLRGLDLRNNGNYPYYVNSPFQNCEVIHGSPMYYDSLERSWKQICSAIFSAKFDRVNGIALEWKADPNNELSGRILRLVLRCNYTNGLQPLKGCLLLKAVGDVTYNYVNQSIVSETPCPSTTMLSLVPTEPLATSPLMPSPSSFSSLPLPLPSRSSSSSSPIPSSLSTLPSPSVPLPSPPSSSTAHVATTVPLSQGTTASSESQTTQISDQYKTSSSKILSPSNLKTKNTVPFSSTLVSTDILQPDISTTIFYVDSTKSSLATKAASSSATIAGPGKKGARSTGNDNGVVIGAAVGGAVVFGIVVITIIVLCRRRKLWKNTEKTSELEVKNPVYGSSDIPLNTATENQVKTSSEQDSQPTYQGLMINNHYVGQINEPALHNSPDDNYDNCTVYQSLDKKKPGAPVYESLKKGQVAAGKPNLSTTGRPRERHKLTAEPVYNVLEQPDAEQGVMPERVYGDPGHGNNGDPQDPLYNVLEGPDAEQTYTAPDVGDPLYNVLEGPESRQGSQEPLYNVLESSDAENSSSRTQGPYDGANSEPLYNVLEEPDSDGPNKDGVGCPAPNGSTSPEAHDNPAYEQTLQLNAPYALVHKPGSQRESVYEPLRGPERQDLYMPISKGRTAHT